MKKALVAGGAGFIGSHLSEELLKRGYFVYCVDNLITGSKKNMAPLEKSKNFKFVKKDVYKDNIDIRKLDYIFHLASPASPIDYQNLPEETALVNSIGTINKLKLAKRTGAKVLIASTSEIYGDPLEHPQKETHWGNANSFGPRACYDESKRFAEAITYVYLKKYKLDARIIRIFNTYGPKMQRDDGRVVSNFINQAIKNKPFTIYGDGKQTRSFCYVSDMVDGILKALFEKKTKGEIFNLGNPDEYSMLELAKIIKGLSGANSKFVYKDLPKDDPQRRRPDISKAKKLLNWKPKVKLDEGLQKTIEYYKKL